MWLLTDHHHFSLVVVVIGSLVPWRSSVKLRARGHGIFKKHLIFLITLLEKLVLRHVLLEQG